MLAEAGYDYVEPAIARMLALEESDRAQCIEALASGILPVQASNVFFPRTIRIVGPSDTLTPDPEVASYMSEALDILAMVGVSIVVFGSGASRTIPEGFDRGSAMRQLYVVMRYFGHEANRRGIHVVLEPLNRAETNVFNSIAEAAAFANDLDHTAIGVLADIYHMAKEQEPFDQVTVASDRLWHAHVSALDRTAPTKDEEAIREFFASLHRVNYSGAVSIECRWDNLASQAKPALEFVRRCMA
jgi:sugar phosphate isomerase/epimerase